MDQMRGLVGGSGMPSFSPAGLARLPTSLPASPVHRCLWSSRSETENRNQQIVGQRGAVFSVILERPDAALSTL